MATINPLAGKKILVTRPKQQAGNLCEQIKKAGGKAVLFPVLDIEFKTDAVLANWHSDWDKIVFISKNAVHGFLQQINQDQLSKDIQLVAVGAATAEAISNAGLNVSITPKENGGSEYLLALDEMQNLAGQKILIVRGEGGRELLADTLKSRQAEVVYGEVYRRVKSSPRAESCLEAIQADVMICTSEQSVKNLVSLLVADKLRLLDKPLIVLSDRIKETAHSLGFKQVMATASTSDAAIIDTLMQLEL
jgi:uroporphyrinogen-III synthase